FSGETNWIDEPIGCFSNGYNLLMVKLHMGSMYFYLQRMVQRSMRVEAYGYLVG
ncbi:hypothetical protein GBA52_021997, partial [Prunus armeniaca]